MVFEEMKIYSYFNTSGLAIKRNFSMKITFVCIKNIPDAKYTKSHSATEN